MVTSKGYIDLKHLEHIVRNIKAKRTTLISIMFANNETGILQPIDEIAKIAKKYKVCCILIQFRQWEE